MYDVTKTVREFAVEIPQATRLFETLGIDYCCGGGKSLQDACTSAKVSVDEVVSKLLSSVKENVATPDAEWSTAKLSELVDHVVAKHHVYVRQELPRLEQLLNKVVSKHSEKHPELKKVQSIFKLVSQELTSHLRKEEEILFPYVKELESCKENSTSMRRPMFGSVSNPIHMMEIEHDAAGNEMRDLRAITNGFVAPEEGCFTYQTLYRGFAEFEADLHQHIHLENNILFPRAIAMETNRR